MLTDTCHTNSKNISDSRLDEIKIELNWISKIKEQVDFLNSRDKLPEFITTLKELVGETTRWEYIQDKILYCKKHNLDLARYMVVVPVAFSTSAKDMLVHTKELLEFDRPLIAINPTFTKLITSLRTAISDDSGKLSKEDTLMTMSSMRLG